MIELNETTLRAFRCHLTERECSRATVTKYMAAARRLADFCGGMITDKSTLVEFKSQLVAAGYAPASVNGMIAAMNKLLDFVGYLEWRLRALKVQRRNFAAPERELTQKEYENLVNTARLGGDERLALLVQTVCATGVRVSEVRGITLECLREGKAEIRSKGKIRLIPLPGKLCRALSKFCKKRGITGGPIFVTQSGNPLDRSNIWKMMKRLARLAKVALEKVFPHNLRHLFARTYYKKYKDIVRLGDILGHSNLETTRIYTARSFYEQRHQMEALNLLL